jgi:hypothetical protein
MMNQRDARRGEMQARWNEIRDDKRSECIKAMARAAAGERFWAQMPKSGREELLDEQTAAFDSLHGLATVFLIDAPDLGDLTNAPEKKT